MNLFRLLSPLTFLLILSSCFNTKEGERMSIQSDKLQEWKQPAYCLYAEQIRHTIDSLIKEPAKSYADEYVRQYYKSRSPFIWITRSGVNRLVDSLIACIEAYPAYGISVSHFHIEDIKEDVRRIRHLDFNKNNNINTVFGRMEYRLTQTLVRYACGQQYGYLRPDRLLNHLEQADTFPNAPFKVLYSVPAEYADEAFVQKVLATPQNGNLPAFLHAMQPDSPEYRLMAETYQQTTGTEIKEKLAVNMERARWKTERPVGKYVWVNLADMTLRAVNAHNNDTLAMKVCGGSMKHKSPMLISRIERMDLNPYWMVPYSIIKKEIAPRYAQNEAYFSRNKIRIFDKKTGEEMEPSSVTASMLVSGNYRLQQDNGDGNSLGRLIFRFPNEFSVFLHDTDNKGAFKRSNRAISHGCIRVEKPLELALFLWDNNNEEEIDKLRMEIGLPPLNIKRKKKDKVESEQDKPLKVGTRRFTVPTPIFIDYRTACPNDRNGIDYYPDTYGYDDILQKKLKAL